MFKVNKIIIYLLLLLVLSSCDGPDTWCWQSGNDSYSSSDTIANYVQNNTEIWAFSAPYADYPDGYGLWVNTGFNIVEGTTYNIQIPGGASGSEIVIAESYASDTNDGLGQAYTVLAASSTPTLVTDDTGAEVIFSQNQQITVSTSACTTGEAAYGTTNPTKWTWDNNWRYETVMCTGCTKSSGNNTDITCTDLSQCTSYAPPTGSNTPTSKCAVTTTKGPDCIAYVGCDSCTNACPVTSCSGGWDPSTWHCTTTDTGTTCGIYAAWGCSHVQVSFASDSLPYQVGLSGISASTYDVCPETQYTGSVAPANIFICQFQNGETSGESAYASTDPTFVGSGKGSGLSTVPDSNNNADFCDGYHNVYPCGAPDNWSKSFPGSTSADSIGHWPSDYHHCGDSDTTEQSSQVIHMTGNVDTCWNTNGFQLFGIQNGVQCPLDEQCQMLWYENWEDTGSTAVNGYTVNSAGDLQFNANTQYIEDNGYVYNSDNSTWVLNNTTSFAALGGPLWLQIVNPNSTAPTDVSTLQSQITSNNTLISSYNDSNDNLYPTLTNQLVAIDNYYTSNQIEDLIQQAGTLGATGAISDTTAQNYMTNILNYLDGYTPTGGAFIQGVNQAFYYLDTALSNDFNPADSSSWEPYTLPTSYVYCNSTTQPPPSSCTAYWEPTSYPPSTNSDAQDIYDLSGNAIILAQELNSYLTTPTAQTGAPPVLTGSTTSAQLESYCNSVISTLQGVQEAIFAAEGTQSQIDYNNAQVTTLTDQNNADYATILSSNNKASTEGLVGGYTAYVKAGPLVADYGQYLEAIIVPNNEDPNNATADWSSYQAIFDFTSGKDCSGNESLPGGIDTKNAIIAPDEADPLKNSVPFTPTIAGTVWMRIIDPDCNYYNNSESYVVDFGTTVYTSGFSTMMTNVIALIKNTIQNTAKAIFMGTTCYNYDQNRDTFLCQDYIGSIVILLHMYVIIFGIMYIFGLIKTDYVDFVMRIVKIGIVITLLQPYSFDFFNTYLFEGFFGFTNTLISAATGAPVQNPFDFISQSVNVLLLDQTTYFKIIGLIFQGLLGIVAFLLMIYGCISFAVAIFNAFIVYMTSFIGMGLCIAIAPIYMIFILFETTRHLFENWFTAMVKLTLIPVILLIGLIVINSMLATILQSALNYAVCFKCTMPFTFAIPGFPQVGTITLFCVSWFSKWGADNVGSAVNVALMTFPLALNFCILTEVMRLYSDKLAIQVASSIAGGSSIFSARNPHASMGMPLKGLRNDLSYMDKKVEKFAIRSGIATHQEEYKGMRNRALQKGLKTTLKVGAAISTGGLAGLAATFSNLKGEVKPTSPPPTEAEQRKNDLIKQKNEINKSLNLSKLPDDQKAKLIKDNKNTPEEVNLSKNKQRKLTKKAAKLNEQIAAIDRKQQYDAQGMDQATQKKHETGYNLERQAKLANTTLNQYKSDTRLAKHNEDVQKTLAKLQKRADDANTKLASFKKDNPSVKTGEPLVEEKPATTIGKSQSKPSVQQQWQDSKIKATIDSTNQAVNKVKSLFTPKKK